MFGVIYKITNKVNGKRYIGQTIYKNPNRRWCEHKSAAKKHSDMLIYRALQKYGEDAFEFNVVVHCRDREHLNRMEVTCIRLFKSLASNHGYNAQSGGSSGFRHSDETKKMLSEINKGQDYCRSNKGKIASPETIRKRVETFKRIGHMPSKTPEAIANMAAAKRGKHINKGHLIVVEGVIYPSVAFAAKMLGIKEGTLYSWVKRLRPPKLDCYEVK